VSESTDDLDQAEQERRQESQGYFAEWALTPEEGNMAE